MCRALKGYFFLPSQAICALFKFYFFFCRTVDKPQTLVLVGRTGKDQMEPFPLSVPSYLSFESENKAYSYQFSTSDGLLQACKHPEISHFRNNSVLVG